MESLSLKPIGIVRSPFTEAVGTPIQPSMAGDVRGTVEVFEPFQAGLKDLDGFERIWLIVWFHQAAAARLEVTPYLDSVPHGLFATRAPSRPNPLGISSVRLLKIERNILHLAEFDLLDGTWVLDIKPYVPRFDVFKVERCGWIDSVTADQKVADARFSQPD